MSFETISVIAGRELKTAVRSRWTATFAAAFAALALAISYFGLAAAGVAGFQGFVRTAASLLNLVLYIVPLVAAAMGALSVSSEKSEDELLFSQPVSRVDVLVGKILGLFAALAAAIVFGFGAAGLVIAGQAGPEDAGAFLALVALALALALIFIVLGTAVAAACDTRAKAFGAALFLWFFFVLFYDLAVIGATLLLKEHAANTLLFMSLFGNPVGIVRVAALIAVAGDTIFGAAGAALLKFLGGPAAAMAALAGALAVWIAAPLALAAAAIRRRDF